jgi:putative Ig domain-containing protein
MVRRGRLRAPILFLVAAGLGLFAAAQTPAIAAVQPMAAPAAAQAAGSSRVANPYSPAYQHPYRHGAVATIQQNARMKSWAAGHAAPDVATGPDTLSYGGGVDGIGVQSGHSKVYLVFYGSQWGTQGADSNGDATFTGDPDGAAPVAQEMFRGIGTGGERWSADLTQWCDGPKVHQGATSCPWDADFVPYQSGGVLAGVWYDDSAPSPSAATGHQLGVEAVNAAAHFGNTTAADNRDAYYVILSPHGTNPDNYQGQYCAWHDYNGDSALDGGAAPSDYGDIAFSNQPYNMDSGAGCGVGFVNSPGTLDGYTLTLGHEWHEMMSDQNPVGGWTNTVVGSPEYGEENSDECAWLYPGSTGGAANITMGSGTFAEQASWSNDTNACAISHPIVVHTKPNVVTVKSPGNQVGLTQHSVSLQIAASDSDPRQTLTYTASGLPAGLTISRGGRITGTPTKMETSSVTVTVIDGTGISSSVHFSWTVWPNDNCSSRGQKLGNTGFETGTAKPWAATDGVIDSSAVESAHSGRWKAWLGGYGTRHTDTLSQAVTIPAKCSVRLSFYLHIDTDETTRAVAHDRMTVQVGSTTVASYSNLDASSGYVHKSLNLSRFSGKRVTLKFAATENNSRQTTFLVDDATVLAY